ncbi:MAG: hypothetical protein H0X46_00255 [Bacteroidetes bacterium]|nr:hypothetical protein [Bacteroidota bacterium]
MKAFAAVSLITLFLFSQTSCTVVHVRGDNGKHKGWFKKSHNPHSDNPGHGNKKPKGKGHK